MQEPVKGMTGIQQVIRQRGSQEWNLDLRGGSVDAQSSKDDGIFLMVTGTITRKDGHPRQVRFLRLVRLKTALSPCDGRQAMADGGLGKGRAQESDVELGTRSTAMSLTGETRARVQHPLGDQ